MPCTISREEELYYEKRHNLELYGEEWTDAQLTEAVACALAKALEAGGSMENLPPYVIGWVIAHNRRDEDRNK